MAALAVVLFFNDVQDSMRTHDARHVAEINARLIVVVLRLAVRPLARFVWYKATCSINGERVGK